MKKRLYNSVFENVVNMVQKDSSGIWQKEPEQTFNSRCQFIKAKLYETQTEKIQELGN